MLTTKTGIRLCISSGAICAAPSRIIETLRTENSFAHFATSPAIGIASIAVSDFQC